MWTYRVILLSLCALMVRSSESGPPRVRVCKTHDYLQIQETCRAENNDLLQAVKTHDGGMVCKKLVDVFYCVAGHVPQCFHNLTGMYHNYFHSPHNCLLSPEHIISLQNLTTATAHRQHPEDTGMVDVEVDIIVPVTTPRPEDSPPLQDREREREEEERVREGGEEGMRQEGHSGSGAAERSLSPFPALLLVIAWTSVCRMTSLLLS